MTTLLLHLSPLSHILTLIFVYSLWALRRSDTMKKKQITHVLSMVKFDPEAVKNFNNESWSVYGKDIQHLMIDLDDVEDADILVELPRAVRFIDEGLMHEEPRGVFVHCVAGKSRSVSAIIAYLLWKHPERFNHSPALSRKETASDAVQAALDLIRQTRPMAEPNPGFEEQLHLWWEMGCPQDVEAHHAYQRWAYKREVAEHLAVGQAPSRLRFEDEQDQHGSSSTSNINVRCKKCRRVLATGAFIQSHVPADAKSPAAKAGCPHLFIEPLSWMRPELAKAELSGRLTCPNLRCGAGVGRYDWKGFKCSCGAWVTPAFSLQRAKVDEEKQRSHAPGTAAAAMGIRMPPGRGGNL